MKRLVLTWLLAVASVGVVAGDEDWGRIYLGGDPAVTADGSEFFFEWNGRLWRASTKGGEARQLPGPQGRDSTPLLSPDGRRLAFISNRGGSGNRVYELELNSGKVRQVSFHSEMTRPYGYTPDGSNLVCSVMRDDAGSDCALRIALVNVFARERERLVFDTEATQGVVSPDGRKLLFLVGPGGANFRKRRHSQSPQKGEIWRWDFATKKLDRLVNKQVDVRDPVWSPDGKCFYYLSTEGGIRNLVRRTFDGKETVLTHFTDEHVFRPSISADGKTAIFRQGFDYWRLDLADVKAKPVRLVLKPEVGYVARDAVRRRSFSWIDALDSPGDATFADNGFEVAFATGGFLWVMDTEVRNPRKVDGGAKAFVRECEFSSDGKLLYYLVDHGDGSEIRVAERAQAQKGWWENVEFRCRTLLADEVVRHNFKLSPDGGIFSWQDPCGRLGFATTNLKQRVKGPSVSDGGNYTWSPDSRWVAASCAQANGDRDILIFDVFAKKGRRTICNVSRNYLWDDDPTWSPDGKLLAWSGESPEAAGASRLYWVYLDKAAEEHDMTELKYENARKKLTAPSANTNSVVKTDAKKLSAASTNSVAKTGTKKKLPMPFTKKEQPNKTQLVKIDFDGIFERVHSLNNTSANSPFFSHDSRTLAFKCDSTTMKVHLPDKLRPQKLFDKSGDFRGWLARGDRVLRIVDSRPAHGDTEFNFSANAEIEVADWFEFGFRSAWGRIRDRFYDPGFHGADWQAMKRRYLAPARNAPGIAVFRSVIEMMLGELDASHLALRSGGGSQEWDDSAPRAQGWTDKTVHLGLRFARDWKGEGWKVRDVQKTGPADRSTFRFRAGDLVVAIDGRKVKCNDDPALYLNGPLPRTVLVDVVPRNAKDRKPVTVRLEATSFEAMRQAIHVAELKARRDYVHKASKGRFGYLHIDSMDIPSWNLFRRDMYAEGFGREGLIIDVRNNGGGYTADKVLSLLCGADHSRIRYRNYDYRGGDLAYSLPRWERPLWSRPIVVLCNEYSASNAEIFTHAIKQQKRGRVVGKQTSGAVISTWGRRLLDFGTLRDPHAGWFLRDGADMEFNGAKPDIPVENLPGELLRGLDPQLDAAIKALAEDIAAASQPKVDYRYAR